MTHTTERIMTDASPRSPHHTESSGGSAQPSSSRTLWFLSSHGMVDGHPGECVSLTFGLSSKSIPHTPTMRGGVLKSLTTMCDHDIGVILDE